MTATTIKIHKETKAEIDKYREYKNESYDELLRKIVYIVKSKKRSKTFKGSNKDNRRS